VPGVRGLSLLLVVAAGCALDVSLDDTTYRCEQSGRCPDGMSCMSGVCRPPGGGGDDAAPPDDDGGGCARPTLDDVSTTRQGDPPATITDIELTHSVSGTDRLLLAVVGYRTVAGAEVSSVNWGETPLVHLCRGAGATGDEYNSDLWYLVGPAEGSATLMAGLDAAADSAVLAAISFTGVDPDEPIGDFACGGSDVATGTKTPTVMEQAVTRAPCSLVFGAVTTYVDDNPGDLINDLVPHADLVPHWEVTDQDATSGWNTIAAGACGEGGTVGWTAERAWPWGIAAAVINGLP
jgi:hypothetical protein